MEKRNYILYPALALGVGGLASWLISDSLKTIYPQLEKPKLNPPDFVFFIVWVILYLLMGIGIARVLSKGEGNTDKALFIWCVQLFANFVWSLIFFNFQAFLVALIWLGFLWLLILRMIFVFYPIDRFAALLQIPYLLWVTFAGYLTYMIWVLNP